MVKPGSTRGRQRVEMKKIQNKTRLGVTFTKRRAGLFKKASELATLCGVQLALLVFSPGKKVYSLGQPNVDTILGRFIAYVKEMHGVQFVHDRLSNHPVDDLKQTRVVTLNAQLKEVERLVETEKNIAKGLKEELQNMQDNTIAYKPKDQLNFSEKLELHGMMQELKGRISSEIQQRVMNSRRDRGEISEPKHNLSLKLGL